MLKYEDNTPGSLLRRLGRANFEQFAIAKSDGLRASPRAAPRGAPGARSATRRPIGKFSAKCCSFSAVSAPIFASKYAFDSIFQNLPDSQAEIFEI